VRRQGQYIRYTTNPGAEIRVSRRPRRTRFDMPRLVVRDRGPEISHVVSRREIIRVIPPQRGHVIVQLRPVSSPTRTVEQSGGNISTGFSRGSERLTGCKPDSTILGRYEKPNKAAARAFQKAWLEDQP
jgi:hypothetical protein